MEQNQFSCGSVSTKYTWLDVAQNLKTKKRDNGDHYTIHDPLINYRCRSRELLRKRIRGYYYGWYILSNKKTWYVWNPITYKIIRLPPLILKDGRDSEPIKECCLSLPPDDPSSVLLLMRTDGPATFIYCRLAGKRKSKKWTEISYEDELERIVGPKNWLHSLTCCSGNIYALNDMFFYGKGIFVIQVDIGVKGKAAVIKLRLIGKCPKCPDSYGSFGIRRSLTGSGSELFCTIVRFGGIKYIADDVYLYKLDINRIEWNEMVDITDMDHSLACDIFEEMEDLKDTIFLVTDDFNCSGFYSPVISSVLGGYIHIRNKREGNIMHSYHVRDRTVSLSSIRSPFVPTSHGLVWECRLEDDHDECTVDAKQTENELVVRGAVDNVVESNESYVLNLPLDMLVIIMELCIGVEYMNFRLTCKCCHLAAPVIKWRDQAEIKRLQTYSLASPWLMVVDKNRGVITFTDPIFGNNYFMNLHVSVYGSRICCSGYGWLLFYSTDLHHLVFFNPFTNNLIKLPQTNRHVKFNNLCFSAPPTSPNCIVVGFLAEEKSTVSIHYVGGEPSWRIIRLNLEGKRLYSFCFPTFSEGDIYALCDRGELCVFKNLDKENCSGKLVVAEAPGGRYISSSRYFLTKYDRRFIVIIVGEVGKYVRVFELNDVEKEWEEIDDLGSYMVYICDGACFCIEARTPEMANKIYFPNLHSKNGKIVFYSLETCKYHTFNEKLFDEDLTDFLGTKRHINPHAWIEPSWSS